MLYVGFDLSRVSENTLPIFISPATGL